MPMKNTYNRMNSYKIYLFIALEIYLYINFLYLDFNQTNPSSSSYIKFSSIALCCLFFFFINEESSFNPYFTLSRIALILTLWADVFLLFTNNVTIGIFLFAAVQGCYHLRLRPEQSLRKYFIAVSYYFFPSLLIMMLAGITMDTALTGALFYFICLLYNGLIAIKQLKNPHISLIEKLFSIGILLLLLCDIQVGIYNVSSYINVIPKNVTLFSFIQEFASVGMWFFYLPSQVIVTISGIFGSPLLNAKNKMDSCL